MDKFDQIIQETRQVGMTPAEKESLREEMAAMTTPRPWYSRLHGLLPALIVLVIGGGVSFAAEGALPGEFLYSVKTGFNEPIMGAFNFSAESKAAWQTELTERRLEEAQALRQSGKLEASTAAELEMRLNNHVNSAADSIEELKRGGESEKAIDAEARLEGALATTTIEVNIESDESLLDSDEVIGRLELDF